MDLLHIGLYTGTFLELIITNYILLIIFRCTLTERYRTIITLSILTALNAVQLYIQQFAKSPAQMYLLYAALMFGIAVFLFHGKWQNRVMAVVLYTITSFMALYILHINMFDTFVLNLPFLYLKIFIQRLHQRSQF